MRSSFRPFFKIAFLFLAVTGLLVFARLFELESVLDPAWADAHLRTGSGALLYIAMAALLSPVGVPRQALAALGGYAFGVLYGTLLCSVGLALGCAAGFFASRLLARSAVQRRFGKRDGRIGRLDAFLAHSPFAMTVAVRFFPMGNNALTNIIAGLTAIPPLSFIGGSALGYLPQTLVFTLLGSGIRIDPLWRTLLAALLFLLATCIGWMLYRRFAGEELVGKR